MNPTLKSCPNCAQPYPSYEGFTDWCQACNWNVKAHHHDVFEDSLYDKFVKKLGDRFSKKLFEYVKTIQDVKPVFRWAAFVTITIAIGVIMLWFAFIAIDIEPGFILDEERYSLLRDELKKFEPEISRTLVDEYKDWIYNG